MCDACGNPGHTRRNACLRRYVSYHPKFTICLGCLTNLNVEFIPKVAINAVLQFGQCRSPIFPENFEATDTSQYTEVVTWKMICGFLRQLWSLISTRACPRNDDRYKTMISQRLTTAALIRQIYLEAALRLLDVFQRPVPDLSPKINK